MGVKLGFQEEDKVMRVIVACVGETEGVRMEMKKMERDCESYR